MIGDDYQRGKRDAYHHVAEYLQRVDDRLRLEEILPPKHRARQVTRNADKWLMAQVHKTYKPGGAR